MEVSLAGKTALITGGSRGLGFAMASRFAQSGADVAIVARRPEVLEEARAEIAAAAPGRTVLTIPADMSRSEETGRAFSEAVATAPVLQGLHHQRKPVLSPVSLAALAYIRAQGFL